MNSASQVNDILKRTITKRRELEEYRRIVGIVEECIDKEDKLHPELREKVTETIYSNLLQDSMKLGDENLLGLTIKSEKLTSDEQVKLYKVIDTKLSTKKSKPPSIDMTDFSKLLPSDKTALDSREYLIKNHKTLIQNLYSYRQLLETMLQYRLHTSRELTNAKREHSELMQRSLKVKWDIIRQKVAVSMFTEIPIARQAYKIGAKDVETQLAKCQREVIELKELMDKYRSVMCGKYKEIIDSYRMYKREIENKKAVIAKIM